MQRAMVQMTRILTGLNELLPNKDLERVIHEFHRQSEALDTNQKSLDEAIDSSMQQFDNEVDETALFQQVCDEIGVNIDMPAGLKKGTPVQDDLIARMEKLKTN